jgi:lipopolysaccharide export system ATP-binding protein
VQSGEIVGLLGPNGAGKTTCFYIACGLVKTDSGQVILNNHKIDHLPMHT